MLEIAHERKSWTSICISMNPEMLLSVLQIWHIETLLSYVWCALRQCNAIKLSIKSLWIFWFRYVALWCIKHSFRLVTYAAWYVHFPWDFGSNVVRVKINQTNYSKELIMVFGVIPNWFKPSIVYWHFYVFRFHRCALARWSKGIPVQSCRWVCMHM